MLRNNELLKQALEKAIAEKMKIEEKYLSEARQWQSERQEYLNIIDQLTTTIQMLK